MVDTPYSPADDIHTRPTAARDLVNIICGDYIGRGMSRWVYAFKPDSQFVIKYEPCGDDFQNVLEWRVWETVKNTPMKKWFAPCLSLSGNGLWLVQRRVTKPAHEKYPDKIPAWFGDTKYANFGMLDGRIVACDYGMPSLSRLMARQARLTKAKWWDDDKNTNPPNEG